MLSKDLEFKLFVYFALGILGVIIIFTRARESRRPKMLLTLFLGYLGFQLINMIEFFPLTAFQMFSFREEKAARYNKLIAVLDNGAVLQKQPHEVLPILADGRARRYVPEAVRDSRVAHEFAKAYSNAYDLKFRKVGEPGIREVRFEQWKWYFMNEPYDADRGFVEERAVGNPRAEVPRV